MSYYEKHSKIWKEIIMKNNLTNASNKQNGTIDEIKELCIKELFNGQNIMNMRPEELKLVQLTLRLIEETIAVNGEVAKVLEGISTNLELLLSETTKES